MKLLNKLGLLLAGSIMLGGCAVPVIVKNVSDEVVAGEKMAHYKLDQELVSIVKDVDTLLVSYVQFDEQGNEVSRQNQRAAEFCREYNKTRSDWVYETLTVPACATEGGNGNTLTLQIREGSQISGDDNNRFDALYTNQNSQTVYRFKGDENRAGAFIEEVVEVTYLMLKLQQQPVEASKNTATD